MKTTNVNPLTELQSLSDAQHKAIEAEFLKEWQPFDKLNRLAIRKITNHFINHSYQFQSSNDISSRKPFKVYSFQQIDNILGLAYTSSSDYAGLWVCNSGYLMADDTHRFIGFAINTKREVIGIAHDSEENEIFIKL